MTQPIRASVRFGSLRVALSLGHERYARAFETHFRSILGAPLAVGEVADLSIAVTDVGSTHTGAHLEVDRDELGRRWRSPAGDASASGTSAHIVMRPAAVGEDELLFWFAVLIQNLLLGCGLVRLHAGAVVVDGRTAVFVGEKGAGKSTLALGLGQRGATVLGDDQIAVQVTGGSVVVAGSHPSIRLTAETESQLLAAPLDVEPVVLAGVAKKEVTLDVLVAAAPFQPHVPTDLWFPAVGERFDIAPLRPHDALDRLVRAVAPHHRLADSHDRADFLGVLSGLVECTRPYRITLSPDLGDLGRVWDSLTG